MTIDKRIEVPYRKIFQDDAIPENMCVTLRLQSSVTPGGMPGNCGIGLLSNVQCGYAIADYNARAIQPYLKGTNQFGQLTAAADAKVKAYVRDMNAVPWENDPNMKWEDLLDGVVRYCTAYNLYVLSDGINKHAECRSGGLAYSPGWGHRGTADFARALIRNKVGYIVQSPVALNTAHSRDDDFGFVQAWLWVPPGKTAFIPHKYNGVGTIARSAEEAADEYIKKNKFSDKNRDKWIERFNSWEKPVTIKRPTVKRPRKVAIAKENNI